LLQAYLRDALRVVDPRAGHVACARYRIDRAIPLVGCPVLLLGHDADPYTIHDLERFTSQMPTARVVVIRGGVVPLEWSAAAVADAVTTFLLGVDEPADVPEAPTQPGRGRRTRAPG
jgi:pimeloyl-ACP methyl ester carboxylesterase